MPRVDLQHDEVLTGEAVALDVQPVGFFLRGLGTLIDMCVGAALFVLFLIATGWLGAVGVVDSAVFRILLIAMLVTVTVVVPTTVETVTRGRSLGKLVVGARIVRDDGGAAGFRQAFIRALVGVFELWFTLGAGAALTAAFTPRAERLGDLLAGTFSERTRAPKLPPPAPGVPSFLAPWAATADVARLPDRLGRRVAQFVRQAEHMEPASRRRVAASLAVEVSAFVAPVPPVDPEGFLRAVAAVRRDREWRALDLQARRVATLAAAAPDLPRGFPSR